MTNELGIEGIVADIDKHKQACKDGHPLGSPYVLLADHEDLVLLLIAEVRRLREVSKAAGERLGFSRKQINNLVAENARLRALPTIDWIKVEDGLPRLESGKDPDRSLLVDNDGEIHECYFCYKTGIFRSLWGLVEFLSPIAYAELPAAYKEPSK